MEEETNTTEDMSMEEMVDVFVQTTGITFEAFCKNPNLLRKSKEHLLEIVDQGQTLFKNVKRQRYFLKTKTKQTYEAKSLERLQSIAAQEGIDLNKCVIRPELREDTSASITLEITYIDKEVR